DAAFIARAIRPGERVAILARYQPLLSARLGRASLLLGSGLVETIRREDAEQIVRALTDNSPEHLFLGGEFLEGPTMTWGAGFMWVTESLPLIERSFELAGWGPGNRLAHFVKRREGSPPRSIVQPDPRRAPRNLPEHGRASYTAVLNPATSLL